MFTAFGSEQSVSAAHDIIKCKVELLKGMLCIVCAKWVYPVRHKVV